MNTGEILSSWIAWKSRQLGRNYTKKELAKDAGVCENTVCKYANERVKRINLVTMAKLALVFDVSLSEFMYGQPKGEAVAMIGNLDSDESISAASKTLQEDIMNLVRAKIFLVKNVDKLYHIYKYLESLIA